MKRFLIFMLTLTVGGLVFAETVTLDEAIGEIAGDMKRNAKRDPFIEEGSMIVASNINSEHSRLSQYIIDRLVRELTNDGTFIAGDRKTLDMQQWSRDRDDEVYYVISGEIALVGDEYHLTVKANDDSGRIALQPPVKEIKRSDRSVTRFDDSWKQKKAYFGGRAGAVMNMFSLGDTNSFYEKGKVEQPQFSFNGAGQFAWQMSGWASIQAEFIFFTSKMEWSYEKDLQTVTTSDIVLPLLFKPTFWIGDILISPFVGPYLKFAWGSYKWERFDAWGTSRSGEGEVVFEVFGGISVGLETGWKIGPGFLFLDARYFFDGGRSRLGSGTTGELLYQQSAEKKSSVYRMHNIMLSIGYAFFGF
ncbi:MAG: PorT family protein [Treponema sp.]|jgi:hypothetical protein|nr:PorT family protein [Treponema sp.]